jgi:RimJ/RimL family protein N-acetyltransferase
LTAVGSLGPENALELEAFLRRLPESDQRWFPGDITDADTVARWLQDDRSIHVVGRDRRRVIAYAAVHPQHGPSHHVGQLTLLVDSARRRQGIGSAMARATIAAALEAGLKKVVVDVAADQRSTIAMFGALGFEPEALLRDHIRDGAGRLQDLIVLAHRVDETWAVMAATGVVAALG